MGPFTCAGHQKKKAKRGMGDDGDMQTQSIPSKKKAIIIAALSRVLMLGISLFWIYLGRPYDTSASLNLPCLSSDKTQLTLEEGTGFGKQLGKAIETTVVWDGVYYVRIAQCGYEYEQTFAFLPVLPLCMCLLTHTVFFRLIPVLGLKATLALSGYVLNNIAFLFAALYFYKVSLLVVKDEKLAFRATALFCFNPASIFYFSIYCESMFAVLSFVGFWHFTSGLSWRAAAFFAISSGVRSNGVLHAGYLLFKAMHEVHAAVFYHRSALMAVQIVSAAALQTALVFAPFVIFQTYGFLQLCHETFEKGIKDSRPWCSATVPYFVQSHYWNVGFLQYFQVKQLPNFLLASPILFLAACSVVIYGKHQPTHLLSLGLCETPATSALSFLNKNDHMFEEVLKKRDELHVVTSTAVASSDYLLQRKDSTKLKVAEAEGNGRSTVFVESNRISIKDGLFSIHSIPFLLEMVFMAFVASFVMHVQVATRFLSVCPPIYWFAAYIMEYSSLRHTWGYCIWMALFTYLSLGSLLFMNFYPFT